ncbi:RNA polymerase sigma factor SigF [Phytohabitans sp. ZYX-F-186]|uniref:RNA polymerase sigma factor SigF n=1 Tax=Phytohabitans maris TaxID=3071409 RepID=A0ABU0ZUH0_9ACTN|nr:RNA polymerase sigma factor SigF [Phytohabitans sp. ZYX-F-186]MDQ7910598.1 RNA polymerase sigma factor SigF [Phytohabitans sp. ZYX-F-186]
MTVTSTHQPSSAPAPSARMDDVATDLLAALARLPRDHPRRAALRERAIERLLPLAQHLARRFRDRGEPFDDLVQTATLGLIKAVDRFDPGRGTDFVGFAVPTVIGEIKRHFRDRTWAVRVPRRLQELRLMINDANATLTQRLGRSPTVAQVAGHLGVSEEDVLEGMEGARAYNATSLSAPVAGDPAGTALGDLLGADDPGYTTVEARTTLAKALRTLPERERQIILMRFCGGLTQQQIADRIGISQMHVSRLLSRTLTRLRDELSTAI